MKKLLFVLAFATLANAADKDFTALNPMEISFLDPGIQAAIPAQLISSDRNPHTRAIGQRVAGWVLLGTAVLNFLIAVPYGELLDDQGVDGELYTALIFAEGGIRAGIGATLLGIGYYKYGQWRRWESEHSAAGSDLRRISLRFEF